MLFTASRLARMRDAGLTGTGIDAATVAVSGFLSRANWIT
jgi:hypothetical protein